MELFIYRFYVNPLNI